MSGSPSASTNPQYFLKTAPLHSSTSINKKFTNLYLRHHSGGINAIMVMPSPPKFIKANSNSNLTRVIFTSASHPGRQWGLVLGRNTNAREDKLGAWEEVLIVEDKGDEGFAWQKSEDIPGGEELVWRGGVNNLIGGEVTRETLNANESGRWRGWMVCDWQYEHPQLFWITDALKGNLPEFCERVRIWREMVE